ncbi:Glu-tRNA(Gln) amidotransferase subunit GatE [Salinivirga cyanobacteriivorans]|uniref:Aspartyl/glutamyl-tRNA(Asn/Gln) amidotransferase subunit B n=1 Tax=Salinivirga cyanobacteriivorans TaxID=1307839 RepID=A0A0S2HZL0_9BACT|nr:Glu-tRNA(Gln) amidotransferase subunit GatE [Salinivirga cyanobacteriivorans]ALO15503.1 Aspartyl/glutamyl-tRNA(Asn/Gln) amidotransferase subunit B [Salinivirga cyanobacteriivorans]
MKDTFDPKANYKATRKKIGYQPRKKSDQKTYDRIGFMSGLEVHQQLKTKYKLFCRCPAGIYHDDDNYDAELIRHMRPTLSELGEYDGTALMEFKTRKNIFYRINNENACTYEVDDTPPFLMDKEALEIALEISLLSKLNVVGEVHITRKQYLDGSIPTGFQRTAILGVEGAIELKNKTVRLIQLSIEEDSCREISDVGHNRIYKTDRLGMPLIETVTYPDMVNPNEVKEACDYIRFLNRSTGKVLTGPGAGRQDVNVSCKGGTRVEIKGVSHTKWIPELTHNEAFRQWALLAIRDELKSRKIDQEKWAISHKILNIDKLSISEKFKKDHLQQNEKLVLVKLPDFQSILSHFTQPGKMFADELSGRLKVVACLEHPNMFHTEELQPTFDEKFWDEMRKTLKADEKDAMLIFRGPEDDIKTALETIQERCQMAFEGVPKETRKSFEDGTTIFERVLPGADRMYPDTDSAPIPLPDDYIEKLRKRLPKDIIDRYKQLKKWEIPEDTYTYILSKNLFPHIERVIKELHFDPKFTGTFFGQYLKYVEGHYKQGRNFDYHIVYGMFKFIRERKLEKNILYPMLPMIYEQPQMEFESVLTDIRYKPHGKEEIIAPVDFLREKFREIGRKTNHDAENNWIMGELRHRAMGNLDYATLKKELNSKK